MKWDSSVEVPQSSTLGFDSQQGQGFFLSIMFRPHLRPTRSVQWLSESFRGCKAAEAWSWPLTSIYCWG